MNHFCFAVALLLLLPPALAQSTDQGKSAQSTHAQASPRASLAEQKLCSDQAEKAFKKFLGPESRVMASGHRSHYDASQSICYAEMDEYEQLSDNMSVLRFVITDAFSKTPYGGYTSYKRNGTQEKPECWVKPRGQSKLSCSSMVEFYDLAAKYFDLDLN